MQQFNSILQKSISKRSKVERGDFNGVDIGSSACNANAIAFSTRLG